MVALLLACGGGDPPAFAVDLLLSPTPPLVGDARVLVLVRDSAGSALEGATVHVSADPPDGTPGRPVPAAEESAGRYVISALPFDRGGSWTVRVQIAAPDGDSANVARRVTVSGAR